MEDQIAILESQQTDNSGYQETAEQRKGRKRSLWIVHTAACVFSLGFSIVLTGVYPYMKQLLPSLSGPGKEDALLTKYGWVVAINPTGQLLFSPVMGYLVQGSNSGFGSIRKVCLACSVMYIAGSALYSCLSLVTEDMRFFTLLFSRGIVGISSAIIAPLRTYLASATYQSERTHHMSIFSAAQALGFFLGPTIQTLLTPLQCSKQAFDPKAHEYLSFDMFTASGWIGVLLGMICLFLFTPLVFTEYNVAKIEAQMLLAQGGANSNGSDLRQPDKVVMVTTIINFFIYLFNFVLVESLCTPLVMDEFGWSESQAIEYMGITLAGMSIMGSFSFAFIGKLSKRFDERKLLVLLGILPMMFGRFLLMPVPGRHHPKLAPDWGNFTNHDSLTHSLVGLLPRAYSPAFASASNSSLGNVPCGSEGGGPSLCGHAWCDTQPAISQIQFFLSFYIGSFGYPFCVAITQSIFSKAIGPRPQGVWMGAITASGSFARVMGPIVVSYLYNQYGLYAVAGLIVSLMACSLAITLSTFGKLIPLEDRGQRTPTDSEVSSESGSSGGGSEEMEENEEEEYEDGGFEYDTQNLL